MKKVKSEDSESVLDSNTEGQEGREVKIPPPTKSEGANGKCCAVRPTFGKASRGHFWDDTCLCTFKTSQFLR